MRKLILNIFLFLGSMSLLFLVSCSDDDVIINEGPQINVMVNGEETEPFEATIGQVVTLNLNVTDNDGVDSVLIRKFVGNTEVTEAAQVIYPSAGGGVVQDVEISLDDIDAEGEVRLEISAYDLQGNRSTATVVINVSAVGSFTTVLLYAPLADQSSQSFFSTTTGQTYSVTNVNAAGTEPVSAQIDFGYYYGATNNATLASPQHINNIGIYNLSGWNTLNTTQFRRTSITQAEFLENEGNLQFISGAFANAEGGQQHVENLQVGDVVAFELSQSRGNRTGLIRVSNVQPGDGVNNFIEIDVLVSFIPAGG